MKYLEEFKNYLIGIKAYSDHTASSYAYDLKEYFEYLKDNSLSLEKLSYLDARDYLKHLNKDNKKTSISRKISAIRTFYKYLDKEGICKNNAFMKVKKPKLDKKIPRFFYYNELEELFAACDLNETLGQRNRLILEFLYASGIRVSELVNIKLNDISGKEIKIRGKGNKDRIVFIGDYAREALDLYLGDAYLHLNKYHSDFLILNSRGEKLTTRGVQYILDKIIENTSIEKNITPHMLRHTFATHLLNEGCDITTVQELLGHESLSSTEVYTHVTSDHIREVYHKTFPRKKK